ncbi:MAG: hypothetical protein IAF58_01795 [Leptolyngbya sp.]|nr:hypothetical protein [Candidatus Melainabacteria bacterium]
MSRYVARVIRAVVVGALGFGGGIGLLIIIIFLTLKGDQNAFEYGIRWGLGIGLVFATLMVALMLPLDLALHMFRAKGSHEEIWELEQTRELAFVGSGKEVMAACRKALLTVPYVHQVSDDMENLVAHASTGPSWRSPGEDLEVEINPISENNWQVKCVSRSRSKSVVFDYAKNFENVETWHRTILSHLPNPAAPPSSSPAT